MVTETNESPRFWIGSTTERPSGVFYSGDGAITRHLLSGETLPPAIAALGPPERTFEPLQGAQKRARRMLGKILAAAPLCRGTPSPSLSEPTPTFSVYPTGLAVFSSDHLLFVPWEAIVEVSIGTTGRLVACDGTLVRLPDDAPIADFEKLRERISHEFVERALPKALEAIARGVVIPFGRFAVDQHGLAAAGSSLPWGSIARLTTGDGGIEIFEREHPHTPWATAKIAEVPNILLMRRIVDQLGPAPGDSQPMYPLY